MSIFTASVLFRLFLFCFDFFMRTQRTLYPVEIILSLNFLYVFYMRSYIIIFPYVTYFNPKKQPSAPSRGASLKNSKSHCFFSVIEIYIFRDFSTV